MSESLGQDSRGLKRHDIEAAIDVFDASRGQLLGRLVNIHAEGLMIVGEGTMQPDHVYQLEIRLLAPLAGAASIRLGVDCLWVRDTDGSSMGWAGCHVIDLSDLARRQIEALVEQLGE